MPRRSQDHLPAGDLDEIPTHPSAFKARVVAVAALALAPLAWAVSIWGPPVLDAFLAREGELAILWQRLHITASLKTCFAAIGWTGVLCAAAGILGLLRSRATYHLLRLAMFAVPLVMAVFVWLVWQGVFAISGGEVEIRGAAQDRATILKLWWSISWPALAVAAYAIWLQVMLRSRSVYAAFTRERGEPMRGDRILEDLRTHGRDPRQRRSFYASALTHLVILVLIPWLLSLGGCVEAYKVPKGSGNPVVAMVKVVKPKKKEKKTLTLRPNSAIIFDQPDLDDTEVDKVMEEKTELPYAADPNAMAGNIGKGGGSKGGWPEGMDDYKIRFIRLDHGGEGWDDGMHQTAADINFLRAFAQATGFKKIARKGESHSIALLRKYPDDGFPPFVYLTGNGSMGRVSTADAKILRDYCLKGGMLIGDAGSVRFHQSFLHFMRQVFPDKPLIDIADDDMIFQLPYSFPDGAPAFWHHGGRRPLGIKHEGRWVVFYHPGDMNDAWKSQGYTDVTPEMRDAAMNLGVNLVYYAFNQWDDAVAKARK
ncbi:MAG: DUF4159 domain-containing protein [Akkermansiaceae bacterium]|nr:DUF4159 domain-containing protein [Akkermansiaceae bacterium]